MTMFWSMLPVRTYLDYLLLLLGRLFQGLNGILGDLHYIIDIHDIQHQSASVVFTYVQTNRTKGETPPCFETMSPMDPGVKAPSGIWTTVKRDVKGPDFKRDNSTISYAHGSPF